MSSSLATLLLHLRTDTLVESPVLLETLSPSIEKNPFLTKKKWKKIVSSKRKRLEARMLVILIFHSLKEMKRTAFWNQRIGGLRMAIRARKVLGTFEKRAPGARPSKVPTLFGWHSSLCIFKAKASQSTKLCTYLNLYSLYNICKDQLYRINGWQFYEWLFGLEKSSGLSGNRALVTIFAVRLFFCFVLIFFFVKRFIVSLMSQFVLTINFCIHFFGF